jgi:segregation and condensation protein B
MSQTPTPEFEPKQQGISLAELTEAFARAMGVEPQAAGEAAEGESEAPAGAMAAAGESPESPVEASVAAPSEPVAAEDACCPIGPRSILEAMLFVGSRDGRPLSASRAAELMRGVEPAEIPDLVDQLNQRYAANRRPYQIVSDTEGYRLTLRKEFHPLRERFYGRIREARLSQAAVDVLAVVAYRQPITAEQVHQLRGKPSNHVLAHLVHRSLLRIERQDDKRRTVHYLTTDRFLRLFGLESLADLPRSEEPG